MTEELAIGRAQVRSRRRLGCLSLLAGAALVAGGCAGSSKNRSSALSKSTAPTTGPASGPPVGQPPGATTDVPSGPWSEGLGDSAHMSVSSADGPTGAQFRWKSQLGAPLIDGPVTGPDGTVYQTASDGRLYALDASTGAPKWIFSAGRSFDDPDLSISPVVLTSGLILWPAPGDDLYAVSAEGKLLWKTALAGRVLSPTVANGGEVYVTDSVGDLEAIDPSLNGPNRQWTIKVGAVSYASPAIGPDGTVYTTADDQLIAISVKSGRPVVKWRFTAGAAIEVSPSVGQNGTVVLGTNDPYEYGINPSGTIAWRYRRSGFSYSSPAVTADGLAYFGDNSGGVNLLRLSGGATIGRYATDTRPLSSTGIGVWTAPAVDARHDVYFGTASGHVYGFGYDGTELFDIDTGAQVTSYPAITQDGALLIGSANGTLYAIGTP